MNTKTNKPGIGVLFARKDAVDIRTKKEKKAQTGPIVRMFTGEIVLPGNQRARLQSTWSQRTNTFDLVVDTFDTWTPIAHVTIPGFMSKEIGYTEGILPVNGRKYKINFIKARKDQTNADGEIETLHYLRVTLPQVQHTIATGDPMFG